MLADLASKENITAEEYEERMFSPGASRGNAIGRMVDASEIGYLAAFLASDKAWAISGEVIMADGGTGDSVYY